MRNEIIDRTQAFLREMLGKSEYLRSHREDLDYRLEHSFRVAHIGKEIAEAEGMDVEKMTVACLLHDVGYYMDFADEEDYINHGRVGAAAARPFLEELGYSENDIDEICYGIAIHVDDIAGFDGERTVFALTIGDADNIDRFGPYRLYETMLRSGFEGLSLEKKNDFLDKRLGYIGKLKEVGFATKTAEKMWQDRLDFQEEFYSRLKKQISDSNWWTVH